MMIELLIRIRYNSNITCGSGTKMKFQLKTKALRLRKLGWSVKDIACKLKISESTSSLWCRQIVLTPVQKQRLEARTGKKLMNFFRIVEQQKLRRQKDKNEIFERSIKQFGEMSLRDKFVAGIAIYWAEGFKHVSEKRLGFCNSDPLMIKFQINFWIECLGIEKDQITARLSLNERFLGETERLQDFWSKYLGLPTSQFTKPFYQKSKTIKDYGTSKGYNGVLRIHARKSSKKMIEMRGFMNAISTKN